MRILIVERFYLMIQKHLSHHPFFLFHLSFESLTVVFAMSLSVALLALGSLSALVGD